MAEQGVEECFGLHHNGGFYGSVFEIVKSYQLILYDIPILFSLPCVVRTVL